MVFRPDLFAAGASGMADYPSQEDQRGELRLGSRGEGEALDVEACGVGPRR